MALQAFLFFLLLFGEQGMAFYGRIDGWLACMNIKLTRDYSHSCSVVIILRLCFLRFQSAFSA